MEYSIGRRNRRAATFRWSAAFTWTIPVIYVAVLAAFAHRVSAPPTTTIPRLSRIAVLEFTLFGLAKQWSPVIVLGLSLAGEPQVPFGSLTMLLGYVLGPLTGHRYRHLRVSGHRLARLLSVFGSPAPGAARATARCLVIHWQRLLHLPDCPWALGFHTLSRPCRWRCGSFTRPRTLRGDTRYLGSEPSPRRAPVGLPVCRGIDGCPVAIIHWAFWIGSTGSPRLGPPLRAAADDIRRCLWAGRCPGRRIICGRCCTPKPIFHGGPSNLHGTWPYPGSCLIPMRGKLSTSQWHRH